MSIALILAGIVFIIGLAGSALIIAADAMSDAPSTSGVSVWPWFLTCTGCAVMLVLSHYAHFHATW